jgi:hypothetical protein
MSTDVADTVVAEIAAAGATDLAEGKRSAESLAVVLATAAERVRSDPDAHLEHCAVRWAAEALSARLDDRMQLHRGVSRDATGRS